MPNQELNAINRFLSLVSLLRKEIRINFISNGHYMKTFLVDAINTFVIKGEGIFEKMYRLLERYPNKKIILTGANDRIWTK